MNTTDPRASIRVTQAPWNSGIAVLISAGDGVAKSVIIEKRAPGEVDQPTMMIGHEAAQVLMDDLWGAGVRPTAGSGSAGQLAAMRAHLEDVRRLAFGRGG